jgi:DNA-directed RNA polymerase subunit K/omega
MVRLPDGFNQFEFAVLSGLRAAQLTRGCTPRVAGIHKVTVMAQLEVAARKVSRALPPDLAPPVLPVE